MVTRKISLGDGCVSQSLEESPKIALFPKKTSILGIILTLFLIGLSSFIIMTLWQNLEEVDDFHFPLVERSAINVRLVNQIDYQFKLAFNSQNAKVVEDLKLNFASLSQNHRSLLALYKNENQDEKIAFFKKGNEIILLLEKKMWKEAKSVMEQENFSQKLEDFSFEIFDETEFMSEMRDNNSEKILKLINQTSFMAIITFIFLIYLLTKIYKGYAANLKQRILAENQAKLLSKQRQSLIHILCHDLGNPVSAIYSLTEVEHLLPEDEKKNMIDTIKTNAKQSLDIIELTRKMQALETGKFSPELKPVNLMDSLNQSLETFSERIEAKNLSFEIDIPSSQNVIAESTSLVNSVLNNLLSNSIKFSYEGGQIQFSSTIQNDHVILEVHDFGKGIPDDILPYIFSELHETNQAGTEGEEGTGFGMPLVKKFMEAYGGKIQVESQTEGPNRGTKTTLTFILPS